MGVSSERVAFIRNFTTVWLKQVTEERKVKRSRSLLMGTSCKAFLILEMSLLIWNELVVKNNTSPLFMALFFLGIQFQS